MRFLLAILITMILPVNMKSQNATATIGNPASCAGDTVLVAVDVTNFIDVGAMTMYIGYDTNAAEFVSLQNVNSAIAGWVSYNASSNQIGIAYSNISPFSITSGKIFDLRFVFLGDSTRLPFLPGTEIANSNLQVIPLDTLAGSIANSIYITQHPDSVQAYPDTDVSFRVTSLGTPAFQWQENSGSGWINLQNNSTYSGVQDDTLYISDVTLDFNLNEYRCILSAGDCSDTTSTGLLEVALAFPAATLGQVSSCPGEFVLEPIYVGDFFDVTDFTFNIAYNTEQLEFSGASNIHPELASGTLTSMPMSTPPGTSITWEGASGISISSGKLFDLAFSYIGGNQPLTFAEGTIVLNSLANPVNITLTNGLIYQLEVPVITVQPVHDTVQEEQQAQFSVSSTGTESHQWQISTDEGETWIDLTDNPPYFNVQSSVLSIQPAIYEMNGDWFRCILDGADCSVISQAAMLTVDTLTLLGEQFEEAVIGIYPNPFSHTVNLVIPQGFAWESIRLFTPEGNMMARQLDISRSGQNTTVNLTPASLRPGLYILEITGRNDGHWVRTYNKIIKTD